MSQPAATRHPQAVRYERIALVDLLDRLLTGGVVITGEIRLAIADVDLVHISLRALISSVSTALEHGGEPS
jgi:Gas vesicle protein